MNSYSSSARLLQGKQGLQKTVLMFMYLVLLLASCHQKLKAEPGKTQASVEPRPLGAGLSPPGITALAFSADDAYMAAGSGDGSLMIWDLVRGGRIQAITTGIHITAIAFSPDGQYVTAGSSAGDITVWAFAEDSIGKPVLTQLVGIRVFGDAIGSLLYNNAGTEIISLSSKGSSWRWNAMTGEMLSKIPLKVGSFDIAVLGNEGGQFIGGRNGKLSLFELSGETELRQFSGLRGPVFGLALSGDGSALAACGGGTLKVWNTANGLERKSVSITGRETVLAINQKASRLLTGSDTGTVRMWNLETGEEIIRYISFGTADEKGEWISVLPSGYYNASSRGDALMQVEIDGQTYRLAQFSNILFRPDIQSKAVQEGKIEETLDTLETLLAPENAPPKVEILGPSSLKVAEGSALIRVKITVQSGGVGHFKVTKNQGKTVVGYMAVEDLIQRQYRENGRQIYEAAFSVPLDPGQNTIGVTVFGERRKRESDLAQVNIESTWAGPNAGKPALHVLLMSIDTYKNSANSDIEDLRYTKEDADALAALFSSQSAGSLYREIQIYQYADQDITKKGFSRIFNEVAARVDRNDRFVFFFAGHGFVDSQGDFFFVPYDSIGFHQNPPENNILMDDIVSGITKVHAKNSLILLDTCQSGALLESGDTAFNRLIRQLDQKAIITATLGNQSAGEAAGLGKGTGHGVFTASLLDSFIDSPESRYGSVRDIISFTAHDVPRKFAAIQQVPVTLGRGAVKRSLDLQRPMSSKPGEDFENFEVFDRYIEPGRLIINSLSAGTVSIFGMPGETAPIGDNGTMEKQLYEGTYSISIQYTDGYVQTQDAEVQNFPQSAAYTPEKPVLRFDYRIPAPGELQVRGNSAGKLRIQELPGEPFPIAPDSRKSIKLSPGQYNLLVEYADKYVERKTVSISYNTVTPVSFTYRIPPAPEGFVLIAPGSFVMGSPASERFRRDNEVQHRVTINSAFDMAKYTVTQREYQEVMGVNPSGFIGANLPVETVSWYDAINYCNARSIKEGLRPAYTVNGRRVTWNTRANGYRLPTEAEWEYACRGGSVGSYTAGATITPNQANYNNESRRTVEGGKYPPNPWGLYDMYGNVWEWCWDWSGPYFAEAETDPQGAAAGDRRIVRGGGFNNSADNLRSAYRGTDDPNSKQNNLGFRVVRSREAPR